MTADGIDPHPLNANEFVALIFEDFAGWLEANWQAPDDLDGDQAAAWNAAVASIASAWDCYLEDWTRR